MKYKEQEILKMTEHTKTSNIDRKHDMHCVTSKKHDSYISKYVGKNMEKWNSPIDSGSGKTQQFRKWNRLVSRSAIPQDHFLDSLWNTAADRHVLGETQRRPSAETVLSEIREILPRSVLVKDTRNDFYSPSIISDTKQNLNENGNALVVSHRQIADDLKNSGRSETPQTKYSDSDDDYDDISDSLQGVTISPCPSSTMRNCTEDICRKIIVPCGSVEEDDTNMGVKIPRPKSAKWKYSGKNQVESFSASDDSEIDGEIEIVDLSTGLDELFSSDGVVGSLDMSYKRVSALPVTSVECNASRLPAKSEIISPFNKSAWNSNSACSSNTNGHIGYTRLKPVNAYINNNMTSKPQQMINVGIRNDNFRDKTRYYEDEDLELSEIRGRPKPKLPTYRIPNRTQHGVGGNLTVPKHGDYDGFARVNVQANQVRSTAHANYLRVRPTIGYSGSASNVNRQLSAVLPQTVHKKRKHVSSAPRTLNPIMKCTEDSKNKNYLITKTFINQGASDDV